MADTAVVWALWAALSLLTTLTVLLGEALAWERSRLSVEEARYRTLQGMSLAAQLEYDPRRDVFVCVYLDAGGTQRRQVTRDYLRRGAYRALIRPDHHEAFDAALRLLCASPGRHTAEYPMCLDEGIFRWRRVTCVSVGGERGVRRVIGSAVDVDDLVRTRNRALREAATDAMTGVCSRKAFLERTTACFEAQSDQAALIMLDVDDYKRVNDRCGHAAGDRKIALVAALLRETFRAQDAVGRYGGDEFLVFAAGITRQTLEIKLGRFRRLLREAQAGDGCPVTCSIGAAFPDAQNTTVQDLIEKADRAMYRAKAEGKDKLVILQTE